MLIIKREDYQESWFDREESEMWDKVADMASQGYTVNDIAHEVTGISLSAIAETCKRIQSACN